MSSDGMESVFFVGMVLLLMVLVGVVVGVTWASYDWRNTCEKHGMVMSGGKVYECKVREEKK
jgi:high-affinity Fe2+/Pb2+ permease